MIEIGKNWMIYERRETAEALSRKFERENKEYHKACKKARKLRRKERAKQGHWRW